MWEPAFPPRHSLFSIPSDRDEVPKGNLPGVSEQCDPFLFLPSQTLVPAEQLQKWFQAGNWTIFSLKGLLLDPVPSLSKQLQLLP